MLLRTIDPSDQITIINENLLFSKFWEFERHKSDNKRDKSCSWHIKHVKENFEVSLHVHYINVPAVRNVCWKTTLLGASVLYGKNCDDMAKARTQKCIKNFKIDDLANQWPHIGIRGPTHQPVITPTTAATIISGIKYPANRKSKHYELLGAV